MLMKTNNKTSKYSYPTKLLIIIATLATVGLVAIFAVVNFLVRDILYQDLIEAAKRDIALHTSEIELWFSTPTQTVRNIEAVLRATPNVEDFEAIVRSIADDNHFIENVFIGFSDGSLLNSSGWRPDPDVFGDELGGIGSGPWAEWSSVDRPWYIAAIGAGEGTIVTTEPYLSHATGNTTFAMATWIPDLMDVGAVVGFSLTIDSLFNAIAQYDLVGNGYLILVGDDGEIMSHPDDLFAIDEYGSFVNIDDTVYGRVLAVINERNDISYETYVEGLGQTYFIANRISPTNWTLVSATLIVYLEEELQYYITIIMTSLILLILLLFAINALFVMRITRSEKETKELNEIFLTHSPLVMNIWESPDKMISTSRQAVDMFGLDSMEQYIERFHELSPEFQPCGMPSMEKALRNNTRAFDEGFLHFEWMHQKLDGEEIPTEIILSRFTKDGKPFLAAFTIDLRLAKAIHDMEMSERVQLMFDSTPLLVEYWDTDYNILDCNETALKYYDFKNKEEYFTQHFDFSAWDETHALLDSVLEKGSDSALIRNEKDNGEFTYFQMNGVRARRNNEYVILTYSQDVTQLKELEAEQAELIQKLEDANSAKSRFLANMSHEIRTPMNAIIGMTGIAKNTPILEKKDDCIDKIERASTHLLGIINQILDISKIEADEFKFYPQVFRFKKLVDGVLAMLSFSIDEKELTLDVHIDKSIPECIVSDELRLAQVITNLLSNAIKFTSKGGCITLVFNFIEKDDVLLYVQVTDTGIGIPYERHDVLFDDFVQVESAAARRFAGAGLGLAISKRIVDLMGGRIWVESEPDKGSRFTFFVPIGVEDCKDSADFEYSGLNINDLEADLFKGSTILVAEDVEINREIVDALLEPTGIEIDYAYDGEQTVAMFCEAPMRYDLILMDIQMPGMDGIDATKAIRNLDFDKAKNIPIVAITANVFREDIESYFDAGMNDHIGKPLDLGQLISKLKKFLNS